jgi:subtilase family serine protease
MASDANDAGRLAGNLKIEGATLIFSRSVAQESDLQTLIAAQQNPRSALFQKWLTPDQFAARFGMADSDLAQVRAWLEQQGLAVGEVSRGRNRMTFSGTVAQIEAAFGTEMHTFQSGTETHFAPARELTIPAAFSSIIESVGNLSDFRPRSHVHVRPAAEAAAEADVQGKFNSGTSGNHYVSPQDVATIYNVTPAYNAGYTGTGQAIAVVGQSAILPQDIANFQAAAGTPVKAPTMVLMPGTGTSLRVTGDEVESDLDVEYAGAIAKGSTVFFVYTGSDQNYGAFDALQYAVTNRLAPIISVSYGLCETALGTFYASANGILAQAAAQGQSVIVAAGDAGSTDCYPETTLTAAQRTALAVDFPADSQYATAMGGSEFLAADVTSGANPFWSAPTSGDTIGSALSYIPEMVWNDDTSIHPAQAGRPACRASLPEAFDWCRISRWRRHRGTRAISTVRATWSEPA